MLQSVMLMTYPRMCVVRPPGGAARLMGERRRWLERDVGKGLALG